LSARFFKIVSRLENMLDYLDEIVGQLVFILSCFVLSFVAKIMLLLRLVLMFRFCSFFCINLRFLVFEKFRLMDNFLLLLNSDIAGDIVNCCFSVLVHGNYFCFLVGFFDIGYKFHFLFIVDLYLNRYIFIDKS
jgi:hypothetical protein